MSELIVSKEKHSWDPTPHDILESVAVGDIKLGDVICDGVYQVDGIANADQRGKAAIRLDLTYLPTASKEPSARMVIPTDHELYGVKRYKLGDPKGDPTCTHDDEDMLHEDGKLVGMECVDCGRITRIPS